MKKQRVNRRIIVPAFTLDKSLVSIERMTPLRLNTLEQNTSAPNSPSPGNKPTSTPRQPTPPHLFPHRTPLMLVKCFICVSQLLFLHVPLRHKQQTRGCKLTFRYQMRQVIHVEEKQQHRLDGTQETTSLLGTTRQLARILGSSSVGAHLLPGSGCCHVQAHGCQNYQFSKRNYFELMETKPHKIQSLRLFLRWRRNVKSKEGSR